MAPLNSDVNGTVNSSFGEFLAAANVADTNVNNWIASQVPEPSSALLLAAGSFLISFRRRR
jgi:hypothetical protein